MLFFHLMMDVVMSCKEGTGMEEGSPFPWRWGRSLKAFCTSKHMLKEQRSFTAITWNKWNQKKKLPLKATQTKLIKYVLLCRYNDNIGLVTHESDQRSSEIRKWYLSKETDIFIQQLHNETKHDLCKTQIPFYIPAGPELPYLVCSQRDLQN